MNLQSLSPLMRNHYATSGHRIERSVQVLRLTNPVSNCLVGGSDTFRKRILPAMSDEIAKYCEIRYVFHVKLFSGGIWKYIHASSKLAMIL